MERCFREAEAGGSNPLTPTIQENMIPLALYLHFPWCVKKCPYCDFNSHALSGSLPAERYIARLIEDFSLNSGIGRKITSIFMGGGTPSLFSAKELSPLFDVILPHCERDLEITLEANPGTIERGQFKDYFDLGINRISLGVQSFNEKHLKKLGRIHNTDDIFKAVDELTSAGFSNFNLDLMHGLPDQTPEEALSDLKQAIDLNPTHLSWYQLTIEPNTYFATKPPTLPNDDALADIEDAGFKLLAQAGFERYEVSAFARDGRYCQHNLNYWQFGDYLGIGAGAHGKINLTRTTKPKLPKTYMGMFPPATEVIASDALPFEFMMNALRLTHGFPIPLFEERTGLPLTLIAPTLQTLYQKKLLIAEHGRIKTTPLGQRFLNDVLEQFLPHDPPHEFIE